MVSEWVVANRAAPLENWERGRCSSRSNNCRGLTKMSDIVKVIEAKWAGDYRLWLAFSDGSEAFWDASELCAVDGPTVRPLHDPDYFGRVFLQMGAPVWPNGFAVDALALHMDLETAGILTRPARTA